jgi:hypothetical protein
VGFPEVNADADCGIAVFVPEQVLGGEQDGIDVVRVLPAAVRGGVREHEHAVVRSDFPDHAADVAGLAGVPSGDRRGDENPVATLNLAGRSMSRQVEPPSSAIVLTSATRSRNSSRLK